MWACTGVYIYVMVSVRKRPLLAKRALELILDSDEDDEKDIATDSYDSSELETESDSDSGDVVQPVVRCR